MESVKAADRLKQLSIYILFHILKIYMIKTKRQLVNEMKSMITKLTHSPVITSSVLILINFSLLTLVIGQHEKLLLSL